MALPMKRQSPVEDLQNILAEQGVKDRRIAELEQKNQGLIDSNKKLTEEQKDFEQFRPILEQPLIDFYNVKLSGTPMMKILLARMTKMYGKRFQLQGGDGQERRYARQRMSEVVTNCVRYCVMQNSRWNDMVAHYMSETE